MRPVLATFLLSNSVPSVPLLLGFGGLENKLVPKCRAKMAASFETPQIIKPLNYQQVAMVLARTIMLRDKSKDSPQHPAHAG